MTALSGAAFATALHAQTLADVARQDEARRKPGDSTKSYSNKDLKRAPSPVAAQPDAAPTAAAPGASPDAAAQAPAAKAQDSKAADAKPAQTTDVRNEAYWRKKQQSLREQLERDRMLLEALKTRVASLNADFVNRDDPAQRAQIANDRQKATAELERMNKSVAADAQAIADFEEEARRASVPPGWLR